MKKLILLLTLGAFALATNLVVAETTPGTDGKPATTHKTTQHAKKGKKSKKTKKGKKGAKKGTRPGKKPAKPAATN
ncbi:MAG: hypothetical protein ABSC03_15055 [Verrucomicrobiota bacterium]|jgi:hypothetical protein